MFLRNVLLQTLQDFSVLGFEKSRPSFMGFLIAELIFVSLSSSSATFVLRGFFVTTSCSSLTFDSKMATFSFPLASLTAAYISSTLSSRVSRRSQRTSIAPIFDSIRSYKISSVTGALEFGVTAVAFENFDPFLVIVRN